MSELFCCCQFNRFCSLSNNISDAITNKELPVLSALILKANLIGLRPAYVRFRFARVEAALVRAPDTEPLFLRRRLLPLVIR